MKTKFGFIGCGNMGGALVRAVSRCTPGDALILCDFDPAKTAALASLTGASVADAKTAAKESTYLFLGVKPQMLSALFEDIRPVLKARTDPFVLVTMAAGISIEAVANMAGTPCKIIRIMPNTPVSVGAGTVLYAFNAGVTEEDVDTFRAAMACAGHLEPLDEQKIDAASAISGCGPAYVCLFAEALADGGVACGLPRDKASAYAAQTIAGTAKLILESGMHPGALKDAVCSPGGTTIEGVLSLEEHTFRAAVSSAVIAAYEKTLKLKK